jgi:uncharacterized Zn-finger protein
MSAIIELKAAELNSLGGVHCPSDAAKTWSSHPKVFIDVAKHGEGKCHYCGAHFKLAAGEAAEGGH